jgi:hypothetical protein
VTVAIVGLKSALAEVNLKAAIEHDPRLKGFRDRLAKVRSRGRQLGEQRAEAVLERLLVGVFDNVIGKRMADFATEMAAIERLRGDLQVRYQRALGIFADRSVPVDQLPTELRPLSLTAVFDQLDRALDDLSAKVNRRGLLEEIETLGHEDTIERMLEPPVAEHGDVQPTLPLDDPEKLGAPTRAERVPEMNDTAQNVSYREGKRIRPSEDLTARADVSALATEWGHRVLGDELERIFVAHVPRNSDANIAASDRLGEVDPHFAGRDYEAQIRLKGGPEFRSDGIRFLAGDGSRFQFLENKEMDVFRDDVGIHPTRRQGLIDMLDRDAAIAQRLRSKGCAGFRYDTGHPALDALITETIVELRNAKVPGADLLLVPSGEH